MTTCCTDTLLLEKSVDRSKVIVGDILTFSIAVVNQNSTTIEDMVIIDPLPPELKFVEGSVVAGNTPLGEARIQTGVCMGALEPYSISTLTFQAEVRQRPYQGVSINKAIAKFKYRNLFDDTINVQNVTSNPVTIKIEEARVKVIKTTEAKIISREDCVPYTVTLINTGTLAAQNIIFTDLISEKDFLIEDSLCVNGRWVSADYVNDEDGNNKIMAYVGTLLPTEEMVISYQVKVMGISCRGYVVNKAFVTFDFNHPGGSCEEMISELDPESISEVALGLSTFKQMTIDRYLAIPDVKPDMEDINEMTVTADLVSAHVITTHISRSQEGQNLSGYKLIVKGDINVVIEYTAYLKTQPVHSAHYTLPFSTFIILPDDYTEGSKAEVQLMIEDSYYRVVDMRNLFANITVLVNAKLRYC